MRLRESCGSLLMALAVNIVNRKFVILKASTHLTELRVSDRQRHFLFILDRV